MRTWFATKTEAEDYAQDLSWVSHIAPREGGWVVYS